jgi:biopolymer transport protein ExbD
MKKRSREASTIDLTPLIDVVFLLLIFFMVSTVFKKEELALILNLPTGETSESKSQNNKSLQVEVTKKEIALNGKKLSFIDFAKSLSDTSNKKVPVILRVDESVEYKKVVKVIDLLKKYKLENLNLITEKE